MQHGFVLVKGFRKGGDRFQVVTIVGTPGPDSGDLSIRLLCALNSAPIRATTVKRAYRSGPVATSCRPGWADCSSGSFLAAARVFSSRGQGQAGAPAAAQRRGRTSLTPASGGRSSGARKGLVAVGLSGVACWFPARGWRSGLTSTHPAPRQYAGGCHDHMSGTGLLSHVIERGAGAGSCRRASSPGAWRPSRLHGRRGGVLASAACSSASRCQARVSSLRATAMVAIFFPRRLAMAA